VKRLIQKGLMFGNLLEVMTPALIERYNRALKHLTGYETTLDDFHIDISGFSPEIADELGDSLYLNQAGVNRQFILLTTEQKRAPLLDAKFSSSRDILRQFIDANEAQLFSLTARDAVAGELVNSVYDMSSPERLLDIRTVRVEADTTAGTVADAQQLQDMITRFKTEPDAWWDDVLIADMIGLAKETGDVTRNAVKLKQMSFTQDNFWTSHFGGIYVFRSTGTPTLIASDPEFELKDTEGINVLHLSDVSKVARFLDQNDFVEPIVKARGIDAAAVLRQKMDFIIVDVAAQAGIDLIGTTRRDMRTLARRHAQDLPQEFHGLAALLRWAEGDGNWPRIDSAHPAYFYSLRSTGHADADLVNQLLSELAPKDPRQLFICHKQKFYADYANWSDAKKTYVADYLEREYLADKVGARALLFGRDAPMDPDPTEDLIARVGPWGAVGGR
jgi:hypothetical protein